MKNVVCKVFHNQLRKEKEMRCKHGIAILFLILGTLSILYVQPGAALQVTTDPGVNATWTDPSTGLMWTVKDNGGDVNWQQAVNYCRNLTLGGYSNWRLPEIDELATIFDPTQNVNGRHLKGGIQTTGWEAWSNTPGEKSGEAWAQLFAYSDRISSYVTASSTSRALCARR